MHILFSKEGVLEVHVTEDRKLLLAQQILKATREGVPYEQVYKELALEWKMNEEECRLLWEEEVGERYQKAVEMARLFYLSQTGKKPSVSGSKKRKTRVRKGVSTESKKTSDLRSISSPVTKEMQEDQEDQEESVNLKEIMVFLEQVEDKIMSQEEVKAVYQENLQLKEELEQMKEKQQRMEEDFRFLKKLFRDAESLQRVM